MRHAYKKGVVSRAVKEQIAKAAQKIYDEWAQDTEGVDEDYGVGGICDDIAEEIVLALDHAGIEAVSVHDSGSNHTYAMAKLPDGIYSVDIPFNVYESGSFYKYTKRPDVVFSPDDVEVEKVFDDHEQWDAIVEGF